MPKVLTNFMQEMRDQVLDMLTRMHNDLHEKKVDWEKVRYFSGTEELQSRIEKNLVEIEKRAQYDEKLKLKL